MRQLIPVEQIKKGFTFHYDDTKNDVDLFFCKCGHIIKKDRKAVATEMKINVRDGVDISDFTNLFDENSMARFNLKCDKCGVDYSQRENAGYVQDCNKNFFEAYCYQEDELGVRLIKQRFMGGVEFGQKRSMLVVMSNDEPYLQVDEILSWIRIEKSDKKLYFKDYNTEEVEITLDKVMPVVKKFFLPGESKITERLFDVHLFIDRMANFVSDSQNINIIDELMSQMVGKSGLDVITKVASIFFGIICYPNLSTIALTKGTVFLFDMMNDCQLPNPKELSDNGATSPLKIFNYLVNFKNEEIRKELDENDREKAGYVFKTKKGEEKNFNFDASRFNKEKQISTDKSGEMFLREDVTQKSVSPYIFNTIERFSDYKTLIKYTKFISYNDIIDLVRKNDINLLINVMPIVEFRADMNLIKLNQIISLCLSSLKRASNFKNVHKVNDDDLKYARPEFLKKEIINDEVEKSENKDEIKLDYTLLKHFDFTDYDDSLRMIRALRWDPNKEFHKIKDIDKLEEYHNQLTEHFNLLTNEGKNKDFVSFVSKYSVLEEYDESKLKVKLIRTPDSLLQHSKDMKNCSGSYVNRVSNGQYLLCMVEDVDKDISYGQPKHYMLGLVANKYGDLEFDQVKAACNVQGSDRFKKNMMDYLQEKEIPYKELSDLKLSTTRENYMSGVDGLVNRLNNLNPQDFGIDMDMLIQRRNAAMLNQQNGNGNRI